MPASNQKKVILTAEAPQPIGPYSQAVQVGNFVFCSGQVGIDPKTGQVASSDVVGQAAQVMKNVKAVLDKAGCNWDSVVKTTIFLKSMNDFSAVNEVYATHFKGAPPARSTVEVSRLPKDVLVEIEVIAAF